MCGQTKVRNKSKVLICVYNTTKTVECAQIYCAFGYFFGSGSMVKTTCHKLNAFSVGNVSTCQCVTNLLHGPETVNNVEQSLWPLILVGCC